MKKELVIVLIIAVCFLVSGCLLSAPLKRAGNESLLGNHSEDYENSLKANQSSGIGNDSNADNQIKKDCSTYNENSACYGYDFNASGFAEAKDCSDYGEKMCFKPSYYFFIANGCCCIRCPTAEQSNYK